MKKCYTLFAFVFLSLTINAQTFLNGDFEINSAPPFDQINLTHAAYNAMVPNSFSFGSYGDMDLITSTTYSGGPQSGNWFVAFTAGGTDMISLTLSAPLTAGNSYTMSFYDRGAAGWTGYPFQVGLSTVNNAFGTAIYTAPATPTIGVWTQRVFTFTAPFSAQYITVTMTGPPNTGDWAQADNFSFQCGLNLGPDTALCSGNTYTINATSPNATAYLWQDGSTNPSFTASAAGLYWAQVTTNGCTLRDTVVIAQGTAPAVNLGSDSVFCSSVSMVLNAGSGASTYLWNDNSSLSTLSVSAPGNYSVTVSTPSGCSATDAITITQNIITASTTSVDATCGVDNGSASVTVASGIGPFVYNWSNGNTTSSITNIGSGTYIVTITGNGDCSVTASAQIDSSSLAAVSITTDKTIMCVGDSATVCAPGGYQSYLWNIGNTTQCIRTQLAGNYYVTVTDNGNCTAASNHIGISVYPLPPVSITVNGDTLVVYNAITSQWYLNNVAIPEATGSIYIANQSGDYSVAVTDSNGCRAVSTKVSIVTGINSLAMEESVNIYPNPLSEGNWQLTVGNNLIGSEVEIFDANGRLVSQSEIRNPQSEIEMNVSRGVYLLRINSAKGTIVRKLVRL